MLRSVRDDRLFYIHSKWQDEAAFNRHAELPHTLVFIDEGSALIDHNGAGGLFHEDRRFSISGLPLIDNDFPVFHHPLHARENGVDVARRIAVNRNDIG